MNKLNKEDIEFLKDLQNEMLTQDKCGTISPRYWVVMQDVKEYGYEEECADGCELYSGEDSEIYTLDECYDLVDEYLYNNYGENNYEIEKDNFCTIIVDIKSIDKQINFYDIEDIKCFLNKEYGYEKYDTAYYCNFERQVENTMFLTLEDCKRHIELNRYHYNNPRPYCCTAWRSPRVERLFKILENTDWSEYNG